MDAVLRYSVNPKTLYALRALCINALTLPAALLALTAAVFAVCAPTAAEAAGYELSARIPMRDAAAQGVLWLDNDNYLTLEVSPDEVVVWRTSFSRPQRTEFLSAKFMSEYVCGPEDAGRLSWRLSPGRRYLYFGWRDAENSRGWTLIDIADAPSLRLKRFTPPDGMQIDDVLFSPDDHYATFRHDYSHEGSEVSLLVMDLTEGKEYWRVPSGQLGFIERMWWAGAIYDKPRFNALAMLYDTTFFDESGLAVCDINEKSISFSEQTYGVLMGAEALWGELTVHNSGEPADQPFSIVASVHGQDGDKVIPLSSSPSGLQMLPEPGLVLVGNSSGGEPDQLWLVNVLTGDKQAVDRDCAEFTVSGDGKVIVRAQAANELRIYELVH